MSRITALSLRARSVVLLATLLVALLSAFGITRLKMELIPNIEFPVLTVFTPYPGAPADAVDSGVTQPVEAVVRGLPGVQSIQSTSSDNFSVIVAEFEFGADIPALEQQLESDVTSLQLPEGAGTPDAEAISFNSFPVIQLALTGGDLPTLRQVAQTEFVPALSGVEGVSEVEVIGGADNVLTITLNPEAASAAGVTPQAISGAIQANNLNVPAGAVVSAEGELLPVRVTGQLASQQDLAALVVGQRTDANGQPIPVTLGEIATISVVPGASGGIARTNGELSVAVNVYQMQNANTVDTAAGIRDALDDIERNLAANGIGVQTTLLLDQSVFIEESIDQLIREALLGAGFAIVVVFIFLLSVRSTLVTAVSIPLSILAALLVMWQQGITINILTLGGLAVAVGRVVDDSIVVLESIYRQVQKGYRPLKAAFEGTKEVALAITVSTLTTVAVFLPLAFVTGIVGELFKPFALTVTISLLASLVVALTVVPVLASIFVKPGSIRERDPIAEPLKRVYRPVLTWALNRPKTTLGIAGALLIASFFLVPFIGVSFLPSSGDKIATVTVEMPPATSQDQTVANAVRYEEVIRQNGNVETIQTQVGGEGVFSALSGAAANIATITVTYDEDTDLSAELERLRAELPPILPEAQVTVSNASSGIPGGNNVQLIVTGDNYEQVAQVAQTLTQELQSVENLTNVENDVQTGQPQLQVVVSPSAAAAIGMTTAQVSQQVNQSLSGVQVGTLSIDGVPYQTTIVTPNIATSADQLAQVPVGTGTVVPLSQVATITETIAPAQILRTDGARSATVTGTITVDETGGVLADVMEIVNGIETPEGVEITNAGIAEQQNEAFASLGIAVLVAIAAVYLIMVAAFGSLTTPFTILFSLPLAIIGVLVALAVTGTNLSISALIGVLMLVGIVVTNAIVLLELVLDLRRQGHPLREALLEGGSTRLRPIMMTALATILALTPLALSGEGGAIIATDLAVVVIGGLFSSTLLTLIVVPVVYELIAGWQERRSQRHGEGAAEEALSEPATVGATPPVS